MALETTKELTRLSGGKIPLGSIWIYTLFTDPKMELYRAEFRLYYSLDAYKQGKPEIPLQDIEEMTLNGSVKAIGELPIDPSGNPGDFENWYSAFDAMAKSVLLTLCQLNETDIVMIGKIPPLIMDE